MDVTWDATAFGEDSGVPGHGIAQHVVTVAIVPESILGAANSTLAVVVTTVDPGSSASTSTRGPSLSSTPHRIHRQRVTLSLAALETLRQILQADASKAVDVAVCVTATNAAGLTSRSVCADTVALVAGTELTTLLLRADS